MPALKISKNRMRIAIAATALTASIAASATTLTYSFDTTVLPTGPLTAPNTDYNVLLPKFNPTLGILDSVTFSLTGTTLVDMKFSNKSTSSMNTITGTDTVSLMITDTTLGLNSFNVNSAPSHSGTYATSPDGLAHYSAPYGEIFPTDVNTLTQSQSIANFASVTGMDSLSIKLRWTAASQSKDSAGNKFAVIQTHATGSGFIEYNYHTEAVPEPTSVAALGLGAFGLLRRRNRKGGTR